MNQLTTIRTTQPISASTIHVCDIFHTSSDMPTMPIPSTHTRASAGSDRRRWNLAIEALAPARCMDG